MSPAFHHSLTARRLLALGACLVLAAACVVASGGSADDAAAPMSDAPTLLEIAGRTNATPAIAVSGSMVAVAWGATTSASKTDIFLAVSRDGGATFGTPVRVNAVEGEARLNTEMPPRLALSQGATPVVTILWTARGDVTSIKLARSRDGGRTFEAGHALQAEGAPGDRGWPSMALDPAGEPLALWLDHRGMPKSAAGAAHHHGSGAASAPASPAASATPPSGVYVTSEPGHERALAMGVCYCCKTTLASGPRGLVLAAWRHVFPGDLRDVAFSVSRDGGKSFAPFGRVSEDGWAIQACPDDGPAAVFDRAGAAHIVWPTVVPAEGKGALFYAVSTDGKAFSPRQRVPTLGSPRPTHPQIAIDEAGGVWIAWDELQGSRRVAAVRPAPKSPGDAFGDPVLLESGPRAANPVLAPLGSGLIAAWVSGTGTDAAIAVKRVR